MNWIDDDLCAVAEIAELTFPNRQAVRFGRGKPVLEAHDRFFRENRIRHRKFGLVGGDVLQRYIQTSGRLIVQYRVPMKKRSPSAVLAGQANRVSFLYQARVGESLSAAPIQSQIAVHHLLARLQDGEYAGVQLPVGGIGGDGLPEHSQAAHIDGGTHWFRPVGTQILAPIHRVLIADQTQGGTRLRLALIESIAILLDHRRGFCSGQNAFAGQLVRVKLADRRLLADDLVHERLRRRGFIPLVVAVPAIAHEIDHHVLVEFHAIFEREARDEAHSLRIIGIHVENGGLDHLRHVRAVQSGARIVRIAGGET